MSRYEIAFPVWLICHTGFFCLKNTVFSRVFKIFMTNTKYIKILKNVMPHIENGMSQC